MRKSWLATIIAVSSLFVAISPTIASAESLNNPKAPAQQGNGSCGGDIGTTPIGSVNFHRDGDLVTINVLLHDAQPNATYNVFLFDSFCNQIDGTLGTVTTNSKGVGNATFSVTVPSTATGFFADPTTAAGPHVAGLQNDTPIVALP